MATHGMLRDLARKHGNGQYGDCEKCGKGIYQDRQGDWRSIMGNLGKGHDHVPLRVYEVDTETL